MALTVTRNGLDISSRINFPSLTAVQNLTNEVDTAAFAMIGVADAILKEGGDFLLQENGGKLLISEPPVFDDDIVISDGAAVVFAGKIAKVQRKVSYPRDATYLVSCVDHSFEMDRVLAARTYEDMSVEDIIADLIASFAPGFTRVNVACEFVVTKIVFNNVPLSLCIRRLADLVRFDWYIDENKDVHFFPSNTNAAPFSLTDTAGNHVYRSLVRSADGSQVVNRVKVRGGEYDGASYTDTITVKGSDTKSFVMPYKMANLIVELDTGGGFAAQDVGVDFIDTFADFDVLYNFQTQSFRFNSALADGNRVRYSGNPKTPVVAILQDSASIERYGAIEKLVRDTSLLSNATARQRAAAELLTYADVAVDARFKTYTAGLRTGMLINVQASGFADSLLIKRIVFTARTPTTFEYDVTCISTQRYTLIDLLRKIITPDAQPTDEQEVSEQLYAANDKISPSDSANKVTFINEMKVVNSLTIDKSSTPGSTTHAFDCTGADALFVVLGRASAAIGGAGITYNGVPLTQDVTGGATYNTSIWRLNNPATGTNNLVIGGGATVAYTGKVFAVSGLNTSDALEATATSADQAAHVALTAVEAANVWSIGFMVRSIFEGAAGSFTPDTALDVEDYDGNSAENPTQDHIHIMHRVFTRSGTKTIGSSYVRETTSSAHEAAMALYNGLVTT